MPRSTPKRAVPSPPDDDPILTGLEAIAAAYRQRVTEWEHDRAALVRLQNESQQLRDRVKAQQTEIDRTTEQVARQRARADQLAASLKGIHRSLFDGNLYTLILKACLALTGATRGLYLYAVGPDDVLQVRAAEKIAGYPAGPVSEYIKTLCAKVLSENTSLVCNEGDDRSELPQPERKSEQFRNCLITPVVLLHNLDGIVLVADKPDGDFDEDDVAALLSVGDQATVAVENARLQRELQQAYLATVIILADTMELKDPYTHGHCEQVSRYARHTARQLGLDEEMQRVVCYAALFHDIGKIGVSDGILNKTGPLLPEEWDLMRAHVRVGRDLLERVPGLHAVGEAVLHHHEHYDGSGYPDGLAKNAIPLAARIVSVVDAYCAMISRRSYKEAESTEWARAEIERCAGTQFDPQVVSAFLAVLDSPESVDNEDDECGPLPGFRHLDDQTKLLVAAR